MTAVVLAVTHHVRLPGFEVGVRTQTGVDAYAVEKVWLALLAALYPLLAIVPAHFSALSDGIYRYPIKGLSGQPLTRVELAARKPFPYDRVFALVRLCLCHDIAPARARHW